MDWAIFEVISTVTELLCCSAASNDTTLCSAVAAAAFETDISVEMLCSCC